MRGQTFTARERKIAVENLNQISFYIMPAEIDDDFYVGYAYGVLPKIPFGIISNTLDVLGIDTSSESLDVKLEGYYENKLSLDEAAMRSVGKELTLRFSKLGIQKLLNAGVSTPSLNALRGRVSMNDRNL